MLHFVMKKIIYIATLATIIASSMIGSNINNAQKSVDSNSLPSFQFQIIINNQTHNMGEGYTDGCFYLDMTLNGITYNTKISKIF